MSWNDEMWAAPECPSFPALTTNCKALAGKSPRAGAPACTRSTAMPPTKISAGPNRNHDQSADILASFPAQDDVLEGAQLEALASTFWRT